MAATFPGGPGVRQGGGAGRQVANGTTAAVTGNEPEAPGGESIYPRPQPADPGGTNTAGWMKTADYDTGYYGGDSGLWRQV